jgi:hypothetical protein
MAKKKAVPKDPEEDIIPEGKVDEDGDEILDLFSERDDLTDDVEYDLDKIKDDLLADETEDEEFGMEVDEVVLMLRTVKCAPCPGSVHVAECQVRHDHGCPPDKAEKFKEWTDAERKKTATGRRKKK